MPAEIRGAGAETSAATPLIGSKGAAPAPDATQLAPLDPDVGAPPRAIPEGTTWLVWEVGAPPPPAAGEDRLTPPLSAVETRWIEATAEGHRVLGRKPGLWVVAQGKAWELKVVAAKFSVPDCSHADGDVDGWVPDRKGPRRFSGTAYGLELRSPTGAVQTIWRPERPGKDRWMDLYEEGFAPVGGFGAQLWFMHHVTTYECGAHGDWQTGFLAWDAETGTAGTIPTVDERRRWLAFFVPQAVRALASRDTGDLYEGAFAPTGELAQPSPDRRDSASLEPPLPDGISLAEIEAVAKAIDRTPAHVVASFREFALTAVYPWINDGRLGLDLQLTTDTCYACSDGRWSAYTASELIATSQLFAGLRIDRHVPPAVVSALRPHVSRAEPGADQDADAPGFGWSEVPPAGAALDAVKAVFVPRPSPRAK